MTKNVVAVMLLITWISPGLLSFLPIFSGWYTTSEHLEFVAQNPNDCIFVVNKPYCIISSSISFWIPCTIMIFTYLAIFREANRQEKQMAARVGNAMLLQEYGSNSGAMGNGKDFFLNILHMIQDVFLLIINYFISNTLNIFVENNLYTQ